MLYLIPKLLANHPCMNATLHLFLSRCTIPAIHPIVYVHRAYCLRNDGHVKECMIMNASSPSYKLHIHPKRAVVS